MADEERHLHAHGLRLHHSREHDAIDFHEDSTQHPQNWHISRRTFDTVIIFFIEFFTTSMSTAGTALGTGAQSDYGLTRTTSLVVFVLTYQLGVSVGARVMPPFSEEFGRKWVHVGSSAIYMAMSLIIGLVPHVSGAIIGRFLSAMMAAAGGAVAAGSLEDMFDCKSRIWLIYSWVSAATAGLAIGPIYGSYINHVLG
ncbi:Putative major facilitator superfamily domain, MFS transporter superfamily [Septoria linicola]|uniref:Major facilitator superfamily domain, MFS transporter superfamily n=1 Tax=Septoria linicola TaxID=215465 RepID=A0A9Q9ERZ9_9PEZI|nr:putative major facilitator superfamily domain, MFS transporter superfamily [Septoria linicola]USW59088.1 Putative major facilitator superfamily domain, MFS transporter superfamily [Septoria linicola]